MNLLEVKNLYYAYDNSAEKRVIFNNTSARFSKGLMYVIVGESGSGKTTFLSVIAGQDNRYGGDVLYNGEEIKKIGLDKYRRTAVSMIYQNYNLINQLNSIQNIKIAMDISENVREIDQEKIVELLDHLGIDIKKARRKTSSLSGGEQQRVAIARAIMTDSDIIIADEPTGNLDWKNSEEVIDIFKDLAHKNNKCVIVVTHNEKISEQADKIYRIDQIRQCLIEEK